MISKNNVYNAQDIAKYVLWYCNSKNFKISNPMLQKVMYLIQADFLVSKKGIPCFGSNIEARNSGPVIPNVYNRYKIFGNGYLPTFTMNLFDDECISERDKERINKVVDLCSTYTSPQLSRIIKHQKPWKDAYVCSNNAIISNEQLYKFFKK